MVQIQTYHDASTVVSFMLLSIARRYQTPLLKQKKKKLYLVAVIMYTPSFGCNDNTDNKKTKNIKEIIFKHIYFEVLTWYWVLFEMLVFRFHHQRVIFKRWTASHNFYL